MSSRTIDTLTLSVEGPDLSEGLNVGDVEEYNVSINVPFCGMVIAKEYITARGIPYLELYLSAPNWLELDTLMATISWLIRLREVV